MKFKRRTIIHLKLCYTFSMIFFRNLLFILIFLMIASCQQEKVVLRFDSTSMNSQKYSLSSSVDLIVDSIGEKSQGIESQMVAILQSRPLTHFDNGASRYKIHIDSIQYHSSVRDSSQELAIATALKKQAFEFKMGAAGDMQDFSMDAFVPELEDTDIDLRRLLLKIQPVLPGKAVSIGDTWERQQLLPESEGQNVYVYKWFRIEEVFKRGANQLVKLTMNIRYKPKSQSKIAPTHNEFILGSGYVIFNETVGQVDEAYLEINGLLNVLSTGEKEDQPSLRIRQLLRLNRLK